MQKIVSGKKFAIVRGILLDIDLPFVDNFIDPVPGGLPLAGSLSVTSIPRSELDQARMVAIS